jgi:hypothetical protein
LVEAQHRVSTLKLVDTFDKQAMLEEQIQATKPPLPAAGLKSADFVAEVGDCNRGVASWICWKGPLIARPL